MLTESLTVFFIVSVGLFGLTGYAIGQAIAKNWQSVWLIIWYSCLLGGFERFLLFALFEGELLSLMGYLIDTAMIIGFGLLGYRLALAKQMVRQYPWLYEQRGWLFWIKREQTN